MDSSLFYGCSFVWEGVLGFVSRTLLLVGVLMVLCRFILSLSRLLKCLIVVEKFKVLLLFSAVLGQ